jgi:hypothetical protein
MASSESKPGRHAWRRKERGVELRKPVPGHGPDQGHVAFYANQVEIVVTDLA